MCGCVCICYMLYLYTRIYKIPPHITLGIPAYEDAYKHILNTCNWNFFKALLQDRVLQLIQLFLQHSLLDSWESSLVPIQKGYGQQFPTLSVCPAGPLYPSITCLTTIKTDVHTSQTLESTIPHPCLSVSDGVQMLSGTHAATSEGDCLLSVVLWSPSSLCDS